MSTSRAHWATASNGLRHVTAPSGSSWSWEEAEEGGVEQGDGRMPSAAWNTPTPPAAMPVSPSARWQPRTPVATVSRANAAPSFSSADAPAIARTASGALLPRIASGGSAPSAGPAAHAWSGSAVAVHSTLSSAALPASRSFASGVPIAGVPIAGDAAASVSMAYQGGGLGLDPATPAGKIAGALQYATAAVNKVARNTFGMDPRAAASSHVQEKYVDSRRAMTRAGGAAATASAAADWLDQLDHVMPFIMFIFAAFVRFYRMDVPAAVVFDETHFGRFTGQYHAGTYLFDIHPPLGKLVFWAVSRMGGYDATQCTFKDIGNEYAPACLFMILRTTATLFACATVSIMYRIARNWGVSVRGAIIAATLLNLDGLNVGESRLILMDSQLIFWCAAALLSAQYWWARLNAHYAAEDAFSAKYAVAYSGTEAQRAVDARFMSSVEHYSWLVWMGIVCSNCVALKHTGLATPGLIAVETFMGLAFLRRPLKLHYGLVIAAVAGVVYAWYFWLHFHILYKTGDGDGFMPIEFQRTLVGNPNYDPNASKPGFVSMFLYLNREMVSANARITQRHPWETTWSEWPLNLRGVLYFSRDTGLGYHQLIYLLGNPIALWLVLACIIASLGLIVVFARYRQFSQEPSSDVSPLFAALDKWRPALTQLCYCLAGYVLNLLPYVMVQRSCFVYHYMPALMYGELAAAVLLDSVIGNKRMKTAAPLVLGAVIISYIFFCPWIYGIPLTPEGHDRRRWLPRWN